MIFNYDKDEDTFNNSKNLSELKNSIKDFFTKKQDIIKRYNPSKNEQEYFTRLNTMFPEDADLTSEENISLALGWAQ